MRQAHGFTLVEVLVVTSIASVVTSATLRFSKYSHPVVGGPPSR